jgi:hypothetical protein
MDNAAPYNQGHADMQRADRVLEFKHVDHELYFPNNQLAGIFNSQRGFPMDRVGPDSLIGLNEVQVANTRVVNAGPQTHSRIPYHNHILATGHGRAGLGNCGTVQRLDRAAAQPVGQAVAHTTSDTPACLNDAEGAGFLFTLL